jgi:hypothetical protein
MGRKAKGIVEEIENKYWERGDLLGKKMGFSPLRKGFRIDDLT